MLPYNYWQLALRICRPLFFVLMLSLSFLGLSAPGRALLERFSANYLAQRDQEMHDLSRRDPVAAWRKLTALRGISRQHRYAELKTEVLRSLLASMAEPKPALDDTHWQWAEKNARDIDLQLRLSRYLQAHGEPEQALAMLEALAARIPDHEALSLAVIELAMALGRHEVAQQQLQRYVHQGQLLQWSDWSLLPQIQTQLNSKPEVMALLPPTAPVSATQMPATTLPLTAEWLALRSYYDEP